MFTEKEQEEVNRILADLPDFLEHEFDEGGVFNTSIFNYDDIQSSQALIVLGQAGSLCLDVTVWGKVDGRITRVFYLAFWNEQSGWQLQMLAVSGVSLPFYPVGEQEEKAVRDGKHEWDAAIKEAERERRPVVAWYFPYGTLGAENYPHSTEFYANNKAQEGGHYVVW